MVTAGRAWLGGNQVRQLTNYQVCLVVNLGVLYIQCVCGARGGSLRGGVY